MAMTYRIMPNFTSHDKMGDLLSLTVKRSDDLLAEGVADGDDFDRLFNQTLALSAAQTYEISLIPIKGDLLAAADISVNPIVQQAETDSLSSRLARSSIPIADGTIQIANDMSSSDLRITVAHSSIQVSKPTEVAFIDSSVANFQAVVAALDPDIKVVVLNVDCDGVDQIVEYLADQQSVSAIHIISHGSAGRLLLGNIELSSATLANYEPQLARIGAALGDDGDILIYGCDVASGPVGQSFVQQLAAMTGADVAASNDVTGATALGGDAALEMHIGEVTAVAILGQQAFDSLGVALNQNSEVRHVSNGTDEIAFWIERVDDSTKAIDPTLRTWIVIHGRNGSSHEENIKAVTTAIDQALPGDQVLVLDWSEGAVEPFGWAGPFFKEDWIPRVAAEAKNALIDLGFLGSALNLVGHSWGSYVADEIAALMPGGVCTIVALDPAENGLGNYNPDNPGEIDFAGHSKFSWAFYSEDGTLNVPGFGVPGNEETPTTAHEAFVVQDSNHSDIVFLFANMIDPDTGIDYVSDNFQLLRLLNHTSGPWEFDRYNYNGDPTTNGGYEAVIYASSETFPWYVDGIGNSAPEIAVSGGSLPLANVINNEDNSPSTLDETNFGSAELNEVVTKVFTVSNTGTKPLHTSRIDFQGLPGFFVLDQLAWVIEPGRSDSFIVQLDTSTAGVKKADVKFTTNDSDENPFYFTITGTVTSGPVTNLPPTILGPHSLTVQSGQPIRGDQFFQQNGIVWQDADGSVVSVRINDAHVAQGHFELNGASLAGQAGVVVPLSQLTQLFYVPGPIAGSNPFTIEAIDNAGAVSAEFAVTANVVTTAVAGTVSIDNVEILEGDSGTKTMFFKVTRSDGTAPFDVNFHTTDGGATVADSDYVVYAGTLQFAANENVKYIPVSIIGDTKVETDPEAFYVLLSNPTGGAIINSTKSFGFGYIKNDDNTSPLPPQPNTGSIFLEIHDNSVNEGWLGQQRTLTLGVNLTGAGAGTQTVRVHWETQDIIGSSSAPPPIRITSPAPAYWRSRPARPSGRSSFRLLATITSNPTLRCSALHSACLRLV